MKISVKSSMGYLVYIPLVCLVTINIVRADIYLERENEDTIRRRCNPSLSCFPGQLEWVELEKNLTGTLVWPDDNNYTVYNAHFNFRRERFPIVHVVCKNSKDIQLAVRFARKFNLHVTIKSSGFDLWGRSTAHSSYGIILMEMKYISVNPNATARSEHGEVTVETGLNSRQVYDEVEKYDRIILSGSGIGVSLGGFLAGGGTGRFNPALGLGVDNVLEIKVVLADGRVATCTHNKTAIEDDDGYTETRNDGDLFWAMRGGGGGTFGVVVHYVLKLHKSPASYVSGNLTGSLNGNESDRHILNEFKDAFTKWVEVSPPSWGGSIVFYPGGIIAFFEKLGPWDINTESEIEPLVDFQSRFSEIVNFKIANMSKSASFVVADGYSFGRSYATGALIPAKGSESSGVWDFLIQSIIDHHAQNVSFASSVQRLGGKVAEFHVSTSAVHAGFRRAQYVLGYSFNLPRNHEFNSIKQQDDIEPLVAQFAQNLRKYQDGQFVNIGYVASPNWKMDFWGEHYVALLKVKIRYDPDNFFTCYHCVGSDRTDFDDSPTASEAAVTGHFAGPLLLMMSILIYAY